MGCVGMSMEDFCRCTPSEFEAIWEQWREREDMGVREAWERSRWVAMCVLQPWVKKSLRPRDVVEFAWERAEGTEIAERTVEAESAEDVRARYAAAKARYGLR
jgi:hypothetical protein